MWGGAHTKKGTKTDMRKENKGQKAINIGFPKDNNSIQGRQGVSKNTLKIKHQKNLGGGGGEKKERTRGEMGIQVWFGGGLLSNGGSEVHRKGMGTRAKSRGRGGGGGVGCCVGGGGQKKGGVTLGNVSEKYPKPVRGGGGGGGETTSGGQKGGDFEGLSSKQLH